MALGEYTHTHTHILWRNESNYKKPVTHRPAAGAPGLKIYLAVLKSGSGSVKSRKLHIFSHKFYCSSYDILHVSRVGTHFDNSICCIYVNKHYPKRFN